MHHYPKTSPAQLRRSGNRAMQGMLSGDGVQVDDALAALTREELIDLRDTARLLADTCDSAWRHRTEQEF